MLVCNRNSGGEEESDVFGNGVWEVVFWICGWEEGKDPLKGMVESWTDEAISNVGKSTLRRGQCNVRLGNVLGSTCNHWGFRQRCRWLLKGTETVSWLYI